LFSFVPILLPPNPTLSFFTGESAGISSHPFKQITHLRRLCFEGPVSIIVGVSFNSPSRALSCLQIKIILRDLQNISGNGVIKIKSVIFINNNINNNNNNIIIIIIISIATGARASTAICQMRPNI
jgi:hypothetical protein